MICCRTCFIVESAKKLPACCLSPAAPSSRSGFFCAQAPATTLESRVVRIIVGSLFFFFSWLSSAAQTRSVKSQVKHMCGVTRPLGAMVRQLDSARFTMLTGRCQQSARCKLLQDELSEKLDFHFVATLNRVEILVSPSSDHSVSVLLLLLTTLYCTSRCGTVAAVAVCRQRREQLWEFALLSGPCAST